MRIVGIDPGQKGGIAELREDGSVGLDPMPVIVSGNRAFLDIPGVRLVLRSALAVGSCHVFIEKQQPLPAKMGGGNANFQRGYHLGVLEALCNGLYIPYELVGPRRWQNLILADIIGEDTKARARLAIQRLYPKLWPSLPRTPKSRKPHEGLIDAVLIAEYGRRRLGEAWAGTPGDLTP